MNDGIYNIILITISAAIIILFAIGIYKDAKESMHKLNNPTGKSLTSKDLPLSDYKVTEKGQL